MIVPMKKITLIVLDREREEALKALRETGVLHVERRDASSQGITALQGEIGKLDQAIAILSEIKSKKKMPAKHTGRDHTLEVVNRVLTINRELTAAKESIAHLEGEFERLAPWGGVDPADFDYLAGKGIYLFPFEMSVADYVSLPVHAHSIVVNRDKKNVRCVLWGEDDLLPAGMPIGARELSLPAVSMDAMRKEYASQKKLVTELTAQLARETVHLDSILEIKAQVLKELEFETIRAGMPAISFGDGSAVSANSELAWLTGFVPANEEHVLSAAAKKRGWAYVSDDPSAEDIVPTKLRNNPFVNLISPLLEFLGIVPGYNEIDISGWFILFFGLFFAMIFGDGGYGALLVLISLAGVFSAMRKGKKAPTALYMLLYLGAMTVAWGTMTCTWFGLPVASLPAFLRSIALPAFSNENPAAAGNIKLFCFTIALVQLSLAHVIGMIRNIRSPKMLGELGTLLMTVGMFFVVLNLVVDGQKYPLTNVKVALVLVGFMLNFVFINYSGSVLGSVVESLKNFITMFLGVVNVFGDIMSYIRLWAVGLAGSAISATVNSMVGPMFGSLFMFLAVLILFFGHGLNFIMNVLSVIVHGVRLNTLEFSNHLGLTWSGFKYEPFSETDKK